MSRTNCVNCGAPKDTSELKCPFCGTTYLDLTAIDFGSGDPVVCRFVLPDNVGIKGSDGRVVMSMLARPRLEEITQTVERTEFYGGFGHSPLCVFNSGINLSVGVSFLPVARPGSNVLFDFEVKE